MIDEVKRYLGQYDKRTTLRETENVISQLVQVDNIKKDEFDLIEKTLQPNDFNDFYERWFTKNVDNVTAGNGDGVSIGVKDVSLGPSEFIVKYKDNRYKQVLDRLLLFFYPFHYPEFVKFKGENVDAIRAVLTPNDLQMFDNEMSKLEKKKLGFYVGLYFSRNTEENKDTRENLLKMNLAGFREQQWRRELYDVSDHMQRWVNITTA